MLYDVPKKIREKFFERNMSEIERNTFKINKSEMEKKEMLQNQNRIFTTKTKSLQTQSLCPSYSFAAEVWRVEIEH